MKNFDDEKYYALNDVWYCTYEKDGKVECLPAFFDHNDVVIDLRSEKPIVLDESKKTNGISLDEKGNEIKETRKLFHVSPRAFFRDFLEHEKVPHWNQLSIVCCAADIFESVQELPKETILKYLDTAKDAYKSCPPKLPQQGPNFVNYK